MSQSAGDLRVRRTRKLLREALVALIEERGFDRVTVGAITERAMVSRAAFYRNYRDKYQLVEQIFDEAMAEVRGQVADGDPDSRRARWVAFFGHVDEYHRLYAALLGARGSAWFASRMRSALAELTAPHFPPDAPVPGLLPAALSAVFVESIVWWLANDRPVPAAEIADRSADLAGAMIARATSWPVRPRRSRTGKK
ncbi:TetR family transcriptional regulator [Actinocatenispora thailandica]|uniref:TetR family transcriptional regulator n=1 Tax=Actinocatenispora thailandica TaxID=227318 RepID=A0A7R7DSH9_9ACTN|nr:TetR/AcrR family transcriptional regulator [Actinocatenispora thailandica]BCJ36987.1 TetR family transcriptional regulator [Actinocatenispora thailandica]